MEPPKAQGEAYDARRLQPRRELTAEIYDQRKLDRLIREPQNTFSNLAYVVVGWAVVLAASRPAARGLGWAGVFLGMGSGLYHASLLPEWRMLDILGVYAVLYALVGIGLNHLFGPRREMRGREWTGTLLAWGLAIYTGVHRNELRWFGFKLFDSTYVFVVGAALASVLALVASVRSSNRQAGGWAWSVLAVSAGISFSGGLGDRFGGFWMAPDALIQGHSVWHAFGAIAMLAAYEVFAAAGFDRSTLNGVPRAFSRSVCNSD